MNEPALLGGVVAFDFDGTLTVRDSFTAFLRWRAGGLRYALGLARLAPAAVAYLFHRSRGRIKAAAVREFLKGVPRAQIEDEARRFAEESAVGLLRPDALRVWREWRAREAKLVIVSASPDLVVAPFARGLAAHALIATRLVYDAEDRIVGTFDGANCRGAEKVRRLHEVFGPDLRLKAAYGDTSGDREMLELAEEKGYRVFKERP
ncbi:MAG: HAD-IB family hydrolase [Phenylobacterium sp.]|uniref:HAD-IB family hydrolase n=1 Tax=Phenylobacterium sp. TaxID=1871053 RepID=UPI00391B8DA2